MARFLAGDEREGVRNPFADRVERVDKTWSDTNLDGEFSSDVTFDRLVCKECGGRLFEVLSTDSYETTARCPCGMYYIVATG